MFLKDDWAKPFRFSSFFPSPPSSYILPPCVAPFSSRQKPEGRRRRRSSRSRGSPPRGGVAVHQKPEGRLGLVAEAEVEAVGRSREAEAASAAWTLGGGCVGLVDSRRRRLLASCKQLAASRGGRRNQG
nr:hypothetical protein Iba_chr11fCG8510 [Ipomoea batatas]